MLGRSNKREKQQAKKSFYLAVHLCICIIVALPWIVSNSVYPQSSKPSPEIEFLLIEATEARKFAQKQRNHAKLWQERATEARRRAEKTQRKIDKDSYLEDAREFDQRAEVAAINADKAEAKAAQSETDAQQLLAIPTNDSPTLSETENDPPKTPASNAGTMA